MPSSLTKFGSLDIEKIKMIGSQMAFNSTKSLAYYMKRYSLAYFFPLRVQSKIDNGNGTVKGFLFYKNYQAFTRDYNFKPICDLLQMGLASS